MAQRPRTSVGALLLAAGVALGAPPAPSAAPVVPGHGLQRHFVWHTGDGSVKTLPLGERVLVEVANPTCTAGQIPGQSPHFCTTNPPTPTPADRPTRLVLVLEPDAPALARVLGLAGADAILGPNPFQSGASDDPADYVAAGPLADRANPLRGPRPPTGNGLVTMGVQRGPRTNEPLSYRWTELDDQTRASFPAAIAPPLALPYGFDPVDPRIASDASGGDGIFDAGQAFASIFDYPQAAFVRSLVNELSRVAPFGGDFSGIVPCEFPDVQPQSSAQQQIAGGGLRQSGSVPTPRPPIMGARAFQ